MSELHFMFLRCSDESIIIPCEYCEAPVKAENWEWHVVRQFGFIEFFQFISLQEKCAEAEKRRMEKMSE